MQRPSLVIRNYGPDDIEAYSVLMNAADRADRLDKPNSLEEVREWLRLPNCDPERNHFLAFLGGTLVGYLDLHPEIEVGRVVLEAAVHPAYRGQGIGRALLKKGVKHGQSLGAQVAHVPLPEGSEIAHRIVEGEGFRIMRYYWLMRQRGEVPAPSFPKGFEVHPLERGEEANLTHIQNLAFQGAWGFRPNSVEEVGYRVWLRGTGPVLLVWKNREVVGYCWTRLRDARGLIWMMGIAPQYRGRGLGRAVLRMGVRALQSRGAREVDLTVDRENQSARTLYESAGFSREQVTLWYQKELNP